MKELGRAKALLLYGGLTREQYDRIRLDVSKRNGHDLVLYASIGAGVFFALLAIVQMSQGMQTANQWIYIGAGLSMLALAVVANRVSATKTGLVMGLTRVFQGLLYAFSIGVSFLHPEYPSVSVVAMLMASSLLFVDRPINMMFLTILGAGAACLVSLAVKEPVTAYDDLWNIMSFGIVALLANVFVMRSKLTSAYGSYRMGRISELDILTGLKNRNSYEMLLQDSRQLGTGTLLCAYVDANGLHELNNEHGHAAGDAMLQEIARQLKDEFGETHAYRVGGDEFVVLWENDVRELAEERLGGIQDRLSDMGYYVSYGVAESRLENIGLEELVREAERHMYAQKNAYYENGVLRARRAV